MSSGSGSGVVDRSRIAGMSCARAWIGGKVANIQTGVARSVQGGPSGMPRQMKSCRVPLMPVSCLARRRPVGKHGMDLGNPWRARTGVSARHR